MFIIIIIIILFEPCLCLQPVFINHMTIYNTTLETNEQSRRYCKGVNIIRRVKEEIGYNLKNKPGVTERIKKFIYAHSGKIIKIYQRYGLKIMKFDLNSKNWF